MNDELKEAIRELIREELKLDVDYTTDFYDRRTREYTVKLVLDGEEIDRITFSADVS